jgi:methionine-gamma-lyase
MTDTKRLGFDSKLVHAGAPKDAYGSAVTPIYQTSTFRFDSAQDGADRFAGRSDGFIYTRLGNPTIRALETCIAELEEGAGAVATSSGMGAVTTAYLALLAGGDHIVSTAAVYGPSRTLMEKHLSRFGLAATYVDTSELGLVRSAMRRSTKMIFVETPSNPLMQITDLRGVAAIAHEHGALLVVDSTFASPFLQKPLALGADVVLHGDQVHQRACGRRGRRPDRERRRPLPAPARDDDPDRLQHGPAPGVPGSPRGQDALAAHGAGAIQRDGDRAVARAAG